MKRARDRRQGGRRWAQSSVWWSPSLTLCLGFPACLEIITGSRSRQRGPARPCPPPHPPAHIGCLVRDATLISVWDSQEYSWMRPYAKMLCSQSPFEECSPSHDGGGEILAMLLNSVLSATVIFQRVCTGLPPTTVVWPCWPYLAGLSRHSREHSVSAHLIRRITAGRVSDMWEHLHVFRVFFMEVIVIWDLGAFPWNGQDRNCCLTLQTRKLNCMNEKTTWLSGPSPVT